MEKYNIDDIVELNVEGCAIEEKNTVLASRYYVFPKLYPENVESEKDALKALLLIDMIHNGIGSLLRYLDTPITFLIFIS